MTGTEHDQARARILTQAAAELYKLAAQGGVDQGRIDNTASLAAALADKAQEYATFDTRTLRRINGLAASVDTTDNIELRERIIAQLGQS